MSLGFGLRPLTVNQLTNHRRRRSFAILGRHPLQSHLIDQPPRKAVGRKIARDRLQIDGLQADEALRAGVVVPHVIGDAIEDGIRDREREAWSTARSADIESVRATAAVKPLARMGDSV